MTMTLHTPIGILIIVAIILFGPPIYWTYLEIRKEFFANKAENKKD